MVNPHLALPEFIGWCYGRASASQDVVEALGIVREKLSGMFFRVSVIERVLLEVVAFSYLIARYRSLTDGLRRAITPDVHENPPLFSDK